MATKSLTVIVAFVLLAGCATAPKTNAQKCADAGGTWNAASNSCQFPSELKPPKK